MRRSCIDLADKSEPRGLRIASFGNRSSTNEVAQPLAACWVAFVAAYDVKVGMEDVLSASGPYVPAECEAFGVELGQLVPAFVQHLAEIRPLFFGEVEWSLDMPKGNDHR